MLVKLHWEIDQFEKAVRGLGVEDGAFQAAAYGAFNCAVTALHCADWAWSSAGESTRIELARMFTFELKRDQQKNLTAFYEALGKHSRAFFACRLIANGSKHMVLRKSEHPIEAAIEYSARVANLPNPIYMVDFIIRDGEKSSHAVEVFREAFEFWGSVFETVGFIEPRFIEGLSKLQPTKSKPTRRDRKKLGGVIVRRRRSLP
jgi:hypothetical protein